MTARLPRSAAPVGSPSRSTWPSPRDCSRGTTHADSHPSDSSTATGRCNCLRVLDLLRVEYARSGSLATFEQLQPILTSDSGAGTYAAVAERLGISTGAVRVAVHRLRQRYGAMLREEVAATLDDPSQEAIDDEVRDLFAALGS